MLDNSHMTTAVEMLRPDYFSVPHRMIYRAMMRLQDREQPIDLTTLRGELDRSGELSDIGGAAYLAGLIDGVPRSVNISPWASIIRDRALREYAVKLGRRLISEAASDMTTEELIDKHQVSLQKLLESFETGNTSHISQVLKQSLVTLEEFAKSSTGITGVPSGLRRFDATTGGFQPGTLITIAARPGHGKTTLVAQMGAFAASAGFKGLVFSMEMEPYQIAQRMLLGEAEVDRWQLKVKSDPGREWERINKAYGRLGGFPLWFDGREQPSLAQIRAASARHKAKLGLDFVIVDYLQRIPVDPKVDNWIGVGENAKGLKTLSRQLHVPVIAACQLGRGADGDGEPTFKDLAQSGVIERESDIVVMLHPETPMTVDYPQVALIMAKHRAGATIRESLSFQKEHTKFFELPDKPEGH